MAPKLRWRDPIGRETAQKIVKKLLPTWKNGLQDFQLDIVTPTLDGVDGMLLTATGDGKSAAFMILILVLQEMARNPLIIVSQSQTYTNRILVPRILCKVCFFSSFL